MSARTSDAGDNKGIFAWFVHSQVAGSVVLLAFTMAALIWANSPWAASYFALVDTYVGVSWGGQSFTMSLGHWVADGLMVIFFFVVGLEIKREVAVGELSSPRKAILPVSAAIGGAIVPAAIYVVINLGGDGVASGWGVPMATDIAFALGILAMFGARAPLGLKVFLTALAIADDLAAVLVIAFFYTEQLSFLALGGAGLFMFLIWLAGRMGVRQIWVFVLLMVGAWVGVLASGVHATIAGVLLAMLIPVRGRIEPSTFLSKAKRRIQDLEEQSPTSTALVTDKPQRAALEDIYLAAEDTRPPGITLEHELHPVQSFLVLPLFALFKAGVALDAESIAGVASPVGFGIILGLFFGKQIGILLTAWLSIRTGYADMPEGVTWPQLWATSCLAGIGFTMAIFIAELAFTDLETVATAKIAILIVSLAAGVFGAILLGRVLPKTREG